MNTKVLSNLILAAYGLMMIVSLVSAVDLFGISHPDFGFGWMMSVAIEISIAVLLMINRAFPNIKSVLYVLGAITLFQVCANTYSAYIHIDDITSFAELFGLGEWDAIDQKRILAFATGGILPIICLSLIYIQNETRNGEDNKDIKEDKEEDKDTEHIDNQYVTESIESNEPLNAKDNDINVKEDKEEDIKEDEGDEATSKEPEKMNKPKAKPKPRGRKPKTISSNNKPAKKKATSKAKQKPKQEAEKSSPAKDESASDAAIEEKDIKDNNESVSGLAQDVANNTFHPKKEHKTIYGDYFGNMYVR